MKIFPAAFLMFVVALGGSPARGDDTRGTPEQRTACAHDAFRLCARYIPDATMVELCLRKKQSDLSAECRSAFERSTPATARSNQRQEG
jgi:hypothetical protein